MSWLHIYDPRERALVAAADAALRVAVGVARPFRRRGRPETPERILVLRLERIGDLLMTLPAIQDIRTLAPAAEIDLAVGTWNIPLAEAIPAVTHVETLDAAWLTREGGGLNMPSLLRAARRWRRRDYDLAINFEPDVRSNLLLGGAGAKRTAGWTSGGGGPLLDLALEYDVRAHTTANARRLVHQVFGRTPLESSRPLLAIPEDARRAAMARIPAGSPGPLVAVHPSGGRPIKQWEPEKFAAVAQRLSEELGATIVLTGGKSDRALVDVVKVALPARVVVDVAGDSDVLVLAAILDRVDLLVTADTGPMHLAAAVGTPVVAVFGPSDPARYFPGGPLDRLVRIDLPCSPCNRIRLPPARCIGHTPDCLAHVQVEQVFDAAARSLAYTVQHVLPAGRAPG
jgi:lipopolysaccharide heptosyltransferase II